MFRIPASVLAIALPVLPAAAQDLEFFTIGSGDVTGGYYSVANAICDVVNRADRGRLRCSPEPTAGSIYNLGALRDRQIEFAMVQSDWQGQALAGTGPYAEIGPMSDLRSVMSLYPETLTLLVRADAGIGGLDDLMGKRVDIGHPASGRRATIDWLMRALETDPTDFAEIDELPTGNALDALCQGSIDATLLIVGHPNSAIRRSLADCDTAIVHFSGPAIDAVIAESDYFEPAVIPAGTYPGLDSDVASFAVTATVVTLADQNPDLVSELVSRTLEHLPALGQRAPVLAGLDATHMRTIGLTAPLHPGAEAAFSVPRGE